MGIQLLTITCACVAVLAPLHAQTAGSVTGSVVDPSGAAVPEAKVSLFLHDGSAPLLMTLTTNEGLFSIGAVRPDVYDLTVEAGKFALAKMVNVKIDAAVELSLPAIRLKIATQAQSVFVSESVVDVNTSEIEVDKTITKSQLDNLPIADRQAIVLFTTQPGVTSGLGDTVINGMRSTSTNVSFDGINIQDSYIRTNAVDFTPNRIAVDQVQEVTIDTSNPNPAMGNGASQVTLVTPSGTNAFHGSLYWYNRNAHVAATDWFSNQTGAGKPPFNLNQFGGTLGGPIKKDKLLFYFNYEGYRAVDFSRFTDTVLTASARQGLLRYKTTTGAVQQLNVLQAAGLTADSTMAGILSQIPLPNNRNVGDGLNTAGYELNAPLNESRKNASGKLDYYLSPRNVLSGSFNYNNATRLRPDTLSGYYSGAVGVQTDPIGKLLSASWRWTPTSQLTNELRGGFNFVVQPFDVTTKRPGYSLTGFISLPGIPGGYPQGRREKIFSLQDNAMFVRGKHTVSFGYQTYILHEQPYQPNGPVVPNYSLDITSAAPFQFTPNNIPSAQASYIGTANSLLAILAGIVGSYSQAFNITSQKSGFVPNALSQYNFVYNTYSGYAADRYRVSRGFTINVGLRYDYWTPVSETMGLLLQPVLENRDPIQTIEDPNAVLNFIGSPGHPFYNGGKKNFSPNVGFAWDLFGDGKTSLRGGYSLGFFNDNAILSVRDSAATNEGTTAVVANNDTYVLLRNGLPSVQPPPFIVPRPIAANAQLNSANAEAIVDPNLKVPYYQQFNIGIERQVAHILVEVRYVGNHGTRLLRSFDENPVNINAGGFLQDFRNAQNNGFLSQAAGQGFRPAYNPAIPGSQPLPVFAQLSGGGLLANGVVVNDILTGQVATLARFYQQNALNGPINFFQNPNEVIGRLLTNDANSTYNSLQTEARGRLGRDLQFQLSYVYGKVLTDAPGTPADNINDLLSLNNGRIERGRASFDLTHVFKANYVYHVPLGAGHRFLSSGVMDRIFGGWAASGVVTYSSGNPFSILDPIGSFSRASSWQTAMIHGMTKSQLDAVVGNRTWVTGSGVYLVDPTIISTTGQGIAPFGSPAYNGEIFFNPGPGQIGNLQLGEFSTPWVSDVDMSAQKTIRLFEQHSLQFRADFYNVFNHPSFFIANANVQSPTFGQANSDAFGPRVIQFGLHYRF